MGIKSQEETHISSGVHDRLDLPFARFQRLHLDVGSHFVLQREMLVCKNWGQLTPSEAVLLSR